jgi:hypothetical protein
MRELWLVGADENSPTVSLATHELDSPDWIAASPGQGGIRGRGGPSGLMKHKRRLSDVQFLTKICTTRPRRREGSRATATWVSCDTGVTWTGISLCDIIGLIPMRLGISRTRHSCKSPALIWEIPD